ncbi:hypothetical protein D083_0915 [Dickeya solani RNS 08.23.3.1.A]|nr:hypothetical protein D083_0915 [Dickeya solani RNS 08.23.3.1.A]
MVYIDAFSALFTVKIAHRKIMQPLSSPYAPEYCRPHH